MVAPAVSVRGRLVPTAREKTPRTQVFSTLLGAPVSPRNPPAKDNLSSAPAAELPLAVGLAEPLIHSPGLIRIPAPLAFALRDVQTVYGAKLPQLFPVIVAQVTVPHLSSASINCTQTLVPHVPTISGEAWSSVGIAPANVTFPVRIHHSRLRIGTENVTI